MPPSWPCPAIPPPYFTTIATFVGSLGDEIAKISAQILYLCGRQGLIGREMFAIDGVKLPGIASKARSGTRADLERQAAKLEAAAQGMLSRHRECGERHIEPGIEAKEKVRSEQLQRDAAELRAWGSRPPRNERTGAVGKGGHGPGLRARPASVAHGRGG